MDEAQEAYDRAQQTHLPDPAMAEADFKGVMMDNLLAIEAIFEASGEWSMCYVPGVGYRYWVRAAPEPGEFGRLLRHADRLTAANDALEAWRRVFVAIAKKEDQV